MRVCRTFVVVSLFTVVLFPLFAQGKGRGGSPTVSSPSSPSMPTITSPTIGGGYYMPGNGSNQAYTGRSYQQKSAEAQKKSAEQSKKNKTDGKKTSELGKLTASDLISLSSSPLVGQLSNILGNTDIVPAEENKTEELLQEVLSQIEEIKEQNSAVVQPVQTVAVQSVPVQTTVYSGANKPKTPHLIRFSVNGYNILHTCRTIYISDVQNDGTFLVTGDRAYESDGKTRTETFHILFKTAAATNMQNYSAAAAVTQDSVNQYSFLYQLADRQDLQALRTGNLVSMRTTDPEWKLELLIDLGGEN